MSKSPHGKNRFSYHQIRNGLARAGKTGSFVEWSKGEQEALIRQAIEAGRVTKCPRGFSLDQGTLGITEIRGAH